MAISVGEQPLRRLTVDEALSLIDVLPDAKRLELLDGMLVEKPVKGAPHAQVQRALGRWVAPLMIAGPLQIDIGGSLRLPDNISMPEPDYMVSEPEEGFPPTNARLVIEVSVTSLRTDLIVKAPMYASADVDEYWVVDVDAREVVVHTEPGPAGYALVRRVSGGALDPGGVDIAPLALEELFAGLDG